MMAHHTEGPWFVSGVRFRMNGGTWHSINRYDEAKKQDENICCVGYDERTGLGLADAHFIVRACNAHDELVSAAKAARIHLTTLGGDPRSSVSSDGSIDGDEMQAAVLDLIDAAIARATGAA